MNYSGKIILCEVIGFLAAILLLWINEVLDVPHYLLSAPASIINWRESAFESGMILLLALFIIVYSRRTLNEIRILKGLLPICATCKKIRDDDGYWEQIECYVRDHSEADFSHSICPECAQKLYPELNLKDRLK